MAKIRADVQPAIDLLDAIESQMGKTPGLMKTAYKRRTSRLRSRMLLELRAEPGKPKYPIRWKSQKQRRYVMAKLRREGNLPYQRTHELAQGWRVEYTDTVDGGILSAYNPSPVASFVEGDDQQPFHQDTGWLYAPGIITKYSDIANNELFETWRTVSDPFAGVPQT